ncbi:MAG: hypothetical protein KBS55_06325 [Bacteroidales bacterium]|nr:hypothetical protein [Candidatus Cryptobacteroides aphodequi]
MADNWLENKEAALRSGRAVYRKDNPSLEQLLRRVATGNAAAKDVAAGAAAGAAVDGCYVVKEAQLQAIVRAAAIIEPGVPSAYEEGAPAVIRCTGAAPCVATREGATKGGFPERTGGSAADEADGAARARFILAAQLKASELSLSTRIAADGVIEVFKVLPER